ncbi:hypothetical protein BT96DRAFT_997947 [Gymnopus androsaceus JB14]|uniref:Uncharacterized protein n=1 Tax=Gymnopus androsaceus JB14 TaxID=1447944 RepID=A0A6A4H9Z8_9AGAR|nr:hypothetical protein BT96DRAFT_997947 [Gymnopus androsaceus JB14]
MSMSSWFTVTVTQNGARPVLPPASFQNGTVDSTVIPILIHAVLTVTVVEQYPDKCSTCDHCPVVFTAISATKCSEAAASWTPLTLKLESRLIGINAASALIPENLVSELLSSQVSPLLALNPAPSSGVNAASAPIPAAPVPSLHYFDRHVGVLFTNVGLYVTTPNMDVVHVPITHCETHIVMGKNHESSRIL